MEEVKKAIGINNGNSVAVANVMSITLEILVSDNIKQPYYDIFSGIKTLATFSEINHYYLL